MSQPIEYLDLDDVLALAERLLGRPVPLRDAGLLGSAVARPQTTVGGRDAYPDLWAKAAALLQSIVNNHALIDGNKRLGWLATAVFLDLNDIDVTDVTNDDVYGFVMGIAGHNPTVEEITRRLRDLAQTAPRSGSTPLPPAERTAGRAREDPRAGVRRRPSAPTRPRRRRGA